MKKAILYIRVSTELQAEKGFSLPAQEAALKKYCNDNNIEIAAIFQDDYSAKDGFERPGYRLLREYLKANKKSVNYLLVTQWSRFSRDMAAAFAEFYSLKALGVTVNAIEQPIDFTIPENLFMASFYFAAPQVENERLAIRTRAGMRQAIKQGRYIYTPPKGYTSNKLTKDIEIDEPIAALVKWSFEEYGKGIFTAEEVRAKAKLMGLQLEKQAFINMLSNQIYIGKVFLKADKDEPAQWINGTHQPIIDEDTFSRVQHIKKRRGKPYKQPKNDIQNALPLRGNLICPLCGRILTGSTPKGNGGKYPYYHCQQTKYGCKFRVSAKNAHNFMVAYLKTFQPSDEIIELFTKILVDIFQTNDKDRHNQKAVLEKAIEAIDKRIETVTDGFADGNIPVTQFQAITKKYEERKNELIMKHTAITKIPANFNSYLSYSCGLIQNLSHHYTTSLPTVQNKLVGLIFPEKLTFTGKEYKTDKFNEVFALMCNTGKGLKENSPAEVARLYSEAPPVGLEPTTL